jgi:hypothetical protein
VPPAIGDLSALQEIAPALAGQPVPAAAEPVARALPRTTREIAGLRAQREELSKQLTSAHQRRESVARDLRKTRDPASRAGLEQRLAVLDRRIVQLENDMTETGRLLTSAAPELLAGSEPPRPAPGGPNEGPPGAVIAIVFILAVLFPLALAAARSIWRRSRVGPPDYALRESAERLARLEHAVDAIAVEVERVSEGQRFVTRLLAESRGQPAPALGEYRPD